MGFSERYIPLQGVNTDLAPSKMPIEKASFLKNLVYSLSDTADGGKGKGADAGVFKTSQSVIPYINGFTLPVGDNYCIGALSSRETRQVFVWIYNSNLNHTLYVLNGEFQTMDIIYQGSNLNFQLNPENFIHQGAACIFILYVTDPDTGLKKRKTFLTWADFHNPNRFLCVEDAIATKGFNADAVSYFSGDYNVDNFINAGVAPDQQCLTYDEVEITDDSLQKNNNLLFNTWQFRTRWVDVWGRPSDWSIISDLYIPGINDCLSSASNIARCLDLSFSTPPPNIDKVEIAYRNCNDLQWYKAETLELFNGSNLGNWWTRTRNQDIDYNSDGSRIIYRFCADHECAPISPAETTRLFNPIPNTSIGAAPIGKTLAYYNNEYGFNPLPKTTTDKITVDVNPPTSPTREVSPRTIRIYAPIWNQFHNNYQMVREDGTSYVWGDNNQKHGGARAYGQYFGNVEQSGFTGYLVGGASAVSTQVFTDATYQIIEDPGFNGLSLSPQGYVMQKWEFIGVPAGRYVFRIASTLANQDTDVNYRKTSTTLHGVFGFNKATKQPIFSSRQFKHELVIDVCEGDYDTFNTGNNEMIVIADTAAYKTEPFFLGPFGFFRDWPYSTKAVSGYIYETQSGDQGENPIELISTRSSAPGDLSKNVTDHNGFYWVAAYGATVSFDVQALANRNVGYYFDLIDECKQERYGKMSKKDGMVNENLYIDQVDPRFTNYPSVVCNRITIKGRIVLSGTEIGIPGVEVVLTRGASSTTDSNGYFTIIAHDDNISNPRKDQVIITNGACQYYIEGKTCIDPIPVTIYRCITCGERNIDLGVTRLLSTLLQRGLLSGGTYAIGVAGKDFLDRSQFVQDLGYITIPTVQETKVFEPSDIIINIDPLAEFPDDIKRIVFYVSEETTISDYVTWIVDSFEFVDNTGEVNNSNPTQIKIYYGSLIEYNKKNNYNTTVNWGFIQEGTTDQPVTTDNVTFLVNGDGKFFYKSITSRVKYASDGEYFLINYTEDLKDLKANAIIRLFRPKQCDTTEPMYEICYSIPIVNGKSEIQQFTLNAFDTYYVSREIPVPVPQQDDPDATVLETRIVAYPFEHDSPSDFWGKGCKNIGRVNFKNPYEAVIYKQDEVALSGSFSDNGYVNYLNYFEDGYSALNVASRKFSFDKSNLQGIVSILPQIGVVLLIGQHNSAVVGFNDNLLRQVGGNIQIPSGEDTFGNPNTDPHANYGCIIFDKNSVAEFDGMVHWLDASNSVIVQHDYRSAFPISKLSADAYTRAKIKEVQLYNSKNVIKRYFVGQCNPLNQEYIVTDKIIGNASYINDKRDKDVTVQETFVYDIYSKMLKDWRSYTPEYYSSLKGEVNDQQLFSFKNGVPYFHYTTVSDNTSYGTFYGTPVERIVEIVVNIDDIKKKKSLFASVYSHDLYFVDRILTETKQESWIPVEYWKQGDYFWSAPILCDLNTPYDPNQPLQTGINKLTDGNMIYGLWVKIRFVGVPADNTKYTELTGFTVDVIPEEKSGT